MNLDALCAALMTAVDWDASQSIIDKKTQANIKANIKVMQGKK
jgi:hypothetical protein